MSIGSKVSVDDPLASLHVREAFVLSEPVNSVAGLPKDERVLLSHNSLSVLLSWNQGLPFEEFEVFKNLTAKAVINAVIYKVVSTIIQLLGEVNLHDHGHGFLGNESARLSNHLHFLVLSREILLEHLVDLWSNKVEVFFRVSA